MDKIPYVHWYTDAREALPFLARGSNAVVFAAVGLLLPTYPDGADAETIAKECALTKRTVEATLGLLIHNGLIVETSGGNFIPVKYIEYRKPLVRVTRDGHDDSINLSNQSKNQSNPSKLSTGKEFGEVYTALAAWLKPTGGMRDYESEDYRELWIDEPDPAVHVRALDISMRRAEFPNYKYYRRVVLSGAIEFATKDRPKEAEPIEVLL